MSRAEATLVDEQNPYRMSISLNVLEHLGLNLYSNTPAVLSEAVANAWDADAERVDIVVDKAAGSVVIHDNGHGMTESEVNDRFLTVGFRRRDDAELRVTPKHNRPVMGRKGIGKLSLFSIANEIQVFTRKAGETSAFQMDVDRIRKTVQGEMQDGKGLYQPTVLDAATCPVDLEDHGTCLVIRQFKKILAQSVTFLSRRLARRFGVIGDQHDFAVVVDGQKITAEDRAYHGKVQYIWTCGEKGQEFAETCVKGTTVEQWDPEIEEYEEPGVDGWIATAKSSTDLKDDGEGNINRIVLLVRGKVAQEDLLEAFSEGGLYTKYVFGEIHADFLDLDDQEDAATSNRQSIKEDDPRYRALIAWLRTRLKRIETQWSARRIEAGVKRALDFPSIKAWYETLGADEEKKGARLLLNKISSLSLHTETNRQSLYEFAILGFERLRFRKELHRLEDLEGLSVDELATIFGRLSDLEAVMYYEIVEERLAAINALQNKVTSNDLEKLVQKHLAQNMWLLDPAWERATYVAPIVEERVTSAFTKKRKTETKADKKRIDIRYQRVGGEHVIVELKRPDVRLKKGVLTDQIGGYRDLLTDILVENGHEAPVVECVILVGKLPKELTDGHARVGAKMSLAAERIRIMTYDEVLENAQKMYQSFVMAKGDASDVIAVLKAVQGDLQQDLDAAAAESEPDGLTKETEEVVAIKE